MDLSSIGTKIILVLTFCILSFGQIIIEDEDDSTYFHENYELLEVDTRISGDVYIIDVLRPDNEANVEELLQNIVETDDRAFVKISGHGISIIRDYCELSDVLKYRDDRRKNNVVDDIFDVLQVAEKKVHIYIITDGSSVAAGSTEEELELLKERDIRIDIIRLQEHNYDIRHRRQINFYQLLANVSGGSVIQTNKQNIGSALNLLKQSIKTSLVHIMRFSDHSPPGKQFHIPVDDTMTQLIFRAQVERSNPVIIAMTPLGIPSSSHPQLLGKASAGTVVGLLEANLSKPTDYGTWKISKLDPNLWDIKVDGQSPVDFTHDFLEPGAGGFGEFPIKGRPIVGKTYKLSITVPEYGKVKTVAMGMLFNMGRPQPIDMRPLQNVGGRRGKSMFYAQFTIPKVNFMIGIEGRDNSGHMFRRIDPILITPISLKLIIPSLTGVKFYQNETLNIPFTVINEGSKEQDVDVTIEDDKKFALAPRIISSTIKPGQNFTGQFVIKAGLTVGETTTVTVTAKPYLGPGRFSQGQFEIRRFTVLDKNLTTTTLTTPTTSTTSTASTTSTSTTSSTTPSTTASTTPSTTFSTTPSTNSASTSSKTSSTATSATASAASSTQTKKMVSSSTQPSTLFKSPISAKTTTPKTTTGPAASTATAATTSKGSAFTMLSSTGKQTGSTKPVAATLPGKPAKTTKQISTSVKPTTTNGKAATVPVTTQTVKVPVNPVSTTPVKLPHVAAVKTTTITKTTTAATAKPNSDQKSDNTDLPTTSIVVGISTGAVVGVAAIGTMALLFRRAMKKTGKAVEPSREDLYNRRRQSSLAWT